MATKQRLSSTLVYGKLSYLVALSVFVTVLLVNAASTYALNGTSKVSVSSSGEWGDGESNIETSGSYQMSPTGRYVVFSSSATNLVPNDTNGMEDVFLRDRVLGKTTRVSVSYDGSQINDNVPLLVSDEPVVSADGRYVAFRSNSKHVVPGDSNDISDVFVRDMLTGTNTMVTRGLNSSTVVLPAGVDPLWAQSPHSITPNGRYIVFGSSAINLVPNDNNNEGDVFIWDRIAEGQANKIKRVSVDFQGGNADDGSYGGSVSDSGRYVAFESDANDLIYKKVGINRDVFVRDLETKQTKLVSESTDGKPGNGASSFAEISGDGHYVLFHSSASDLVQSDSNGASDVFIRDIVTDAPIERVSVDKNGNDAESNSYAGDISYDGHYVSFFSNATDLISNDDNFVPDVFRRNMVSKKTELVPVSSNFFDNADGPSSSSAITADGRYVAFTSSATNILVGENDIDDVFVRDMNWVPPCLFCG